MNRRKILQSLVLIPLASYIKLEASPQQEQVRADKKKPTRREIPFKRERIETVPIAGFQYYQGENLWHKLKINDNLSLIRETENKDDRNAIIIQWKGEKLGYIPRLDNQAIAQLMDEGNNLDANIVKLSKSKNPWNRVEIALYKVV